MSIDRGQQAAAAARPSPAQKLTRIERMSVARPLAAGDRVLLIDGRDRRYLITLRGGGQFHSHRGVIEHDDLIGNGEGARIESTGGSPYTVFRPTLADFILKMQRGAQVIYPKDLGLIIVYADIFPGATVIEAGSGSGSLSLALARAVGESGKVLSYELRSDHHERAVANVNAWYGSSEPPAHLELRLGDVFEGVPERDVDRMVLDLPEPWHALGSASRSLAPGGIMCCFLPTVPQVQQTVEAMGAAGFSLVNTLEGFVRTWNVDRRSVRPDHRMVAHTGFLVTSRKLPM